jgi:hypothetical protein
LGGDRRENGDIDLILRCSTGHHYIHHLKEYPERESVYTKCPECKIEVVIAGIPISLAEKDEKRRLEKKEKGVPKKKKRKKKVEKTCSKCIADETDDDLAVNSADYLVKGKRKKGKRFYPYRAYVCEDCLLELREDGAELKVKRI